jgi:putative hemolysin
MDILLLILLIFINGIFSMSEIAVISSRDIRLQMLVNEGSRGAQSARALKTNPGAFLSTVQVGITMVGILSGAIGENALAGPLTHWLGTFPFVQPHAPTIALAIVVFSLTYFTVVVGELVPKHLGLLQPERIASLAALPMQMLARATKPLVWLFSTSSGFLLRIVGASDKEDASVTNEEIKLLMKQGAESGVFHESEQALVANVLRLDEQPIVAIMTPRQDIYVLDINISEAEVRQQLIGCPFSRIIVCNGGVENIIGLLRTSDLLRAALSCEPLQIEQHLRPPMYVPEYVTITQLLEKLRKIQLQCALIVDEYGNLQGLVTLTDVLMAIVGDVPTANPSENIDYIRREDGSWLIDGGMAIERVQLILEINHDLSGKNTATFHTLGGFVIHKLRRIPKEADHFEAYGYRFEVVDMDKNRVDKVLVSPI